MREVVVTATRYEEETGTIPANVTVITEKDIANSTAQDVPSLLEEQAGVHAYSITGNRRNYRVDLRGFGETAGLNTLVLVDGMRINQPDLSGTDWTLIPLDRIQRIEIVRGSRGSVLYGDNASGGVINIITKEGEQFKAGVEVGGGSYETVNSSAFVSGSKENFSYALSGRYYDSDGYRQNSQAKAEDLGTNLGYFIGDLMKLSLTGNYHKEEDGLPGALRQSELDAGVSRKDSLHPDDYADTEDYFAKLKPEMFFMGNSELALDLSYRQRDSSFFSSFTGGTFKGHTGIGTFIGSPQFIIREPIFGFDNTVTFGTDYTNAQEDITNTTVSTFGNSKDKFDLEKENYGLYIHDEFHPLDSLILSGGYRYDHAKFSFSPSTPGKTDFEENVFSAGIDYNFYKNSYVYFSYAGGFRYPVLDELFDFFTNTILPDLKPQTSDDYEFGIRHYFTKDFYAKTNFFLIDTHDEIFFNPTKNVFGANDNLDAVSRRQGVEASLSKAFERVTLQGSYTYMDTEIRGGQFNGKKVPNVPTHQARVEMQIYPLNGLTVAINGIYVGSRYLESDYANAFPKQDDYFVANAKLMYTWKNFTAFVDILNLLNKKYDEYGVLSSPPVEPAFYPSPQINFMAGVSAVF
jgi:iron complex outermembrane receptor protein